MEFSASGPIAYVVTAILLAVVGFLGYCGFKSATASNQVTFCYVEKNTTSGIQLFELMGHRDWRANLRMGTFHTFNEAVDAAHQAKCEFR